MLKTVQTITTFRNPLADPVGTRRGPPLVRGPQFENRCCTCTHSSSTASILHGTCTHRPLHFLTAEFYTNDTITDNMDTHTHTRHDIGYPLLDAEHSLCTVPWSGTPCRTTSAHSRTIYESSRQGLKPGFSPDTSVFSALEAFVIEALYKSTFTIPYHTEAPESRLQTSGRWRSAPL